MANSIWRPIRPEILLLIGLCASVAALIAYQAEITWAMLVFAIMAAGSFAYAIVRFYIEGRATAQKRQYRPIKRDGDKVVLELELNEMHHPEIVELEDGPYERISTSGKRAIYQKVKTKKI